MIEGESFPPDTSIPPPQCRALVVPLPYCTLTVHGKQNGVGPIWNKRRRGRRKSSCDKRPPPLAQRTHTAFLARHRPSSSPFRALPPYGSGGGGGGERARYSLNSQRRRSFFLPPPSWRRGESAIKWHGGNIAGWRRDISRREVAIVQSKT